MVFGFTHLVHAAPIHGSLQMQGINVFLIALSLACFRTVLTLTSLADIVHLDNKPSPLNSVDENVATGESVVAPGTNKFNLTATL